MSFTWKQAMASGLMLAAAIWGFEPVQAAGRLGERLATSRTSSAREKPATESEEDAKPSGGLLGKRSSSSGRLLKGGKRKEVPPDAKDALQGLDGLNIDLGDTVETLDTHGTPVVPPTNIQESRLSPRSNSTTRDASEPRVTRRVTPLKRLDSSNDGATAPAGELQLTSPTGQPANSR